jgi:PPOX class probable F420-dependent enzyme
METTQALEFAKGTMQSVLTTLRRDGRPQLSNVLHHVGDDGIIRISTTAPRAKYRNLARTPWAALHVTTGDFRQYVVIEGDVELSPVAAGEDDATVAELVAYYRNLIGEHPDWDDYRRAQVSEQRSMVRISPTRAYGAVL